MTDEQIADFVLHKKDKKFDHNLLNDCDYLMLYGARFNLKKIPSYFFKLFIYRILYNHTRDKNN